MSRAYDTYGESQYPDASNAHEALFGYEDRRWVYNSCGLCGGPGMVKPEGAVDPTRLVCPWCHGTGEAER